MDADWIRGKGGSRTMTVMTVLGNHTDRPIAGTYEVDVPDMADHVKALVNIHNWKVPDEQQVPLNRFYEGGALDVGAFARFILRAHLDGLGRDFTWRVREVHVERAVP
jgi:hypothetical protein